MSAIRTARALMVLVAASVDASANVGFFHGNGHTVQLQNTEDIQLVSEDVRIVVDARGADYSCLFQLKNLTDKPVSIQVGFPLSSDIEETRSRRVLKDGEWVPGPPPDDEAKIVAEEYRFIARDARRTYHARYVERDQQARFRHLLLWEMDFAPGEIIELRVCYSLGLSTMLFSTDRRVWERLFTDSTLPDWFMASEDQVVWNASLGAIVFCEYVTETGASWAGRIEDARFSIDTSALEDDIRLLGLQGATLDRFQLPDPPVRTITWRGLRPDGWTVAPPDDRPPPELRFPLVGRGTPGLTEWHFAPFTPRLPFVVSYIESALPAEATGVRGWFEAFASTLSESPAPTAAEFAELRQVLVAMCGVEPPKGRVHDLVELLVWYAPVAGRTEADFDARQQALLAAWDAAVAKELASAASGGTDPAK